MNVKLVDITENPVEKIFKSYRICYSKCNYENVKIKSIDEMCEFIKPLMAEGHTSPLEHVSFTFSIEGLSRAALAQLTRHRTFKFNVQSMRYVDANNFDFVIPKFDYLEEDKRQEVITLFENYTNFSKAVYNILITDYGAEKEDARAVLPLATTCNLTVTCDLNNFRKFLNQRLCETAQQEIRELAEKMAELVKEYIPFTTYKVMNCYRCKRIKECKVVKLKKY